jgi:outer membrane protein OmpA-like peptidoglycan-associated protein
VNLEGWLRAENDFAAARSALADGDHPRAVRLAEQASSAFQAIVAPTPTKPTFSIPADVTSVSRAGSQLYVNPSVAFRTGSSLIDKSSKTSIEDLAKVIKANASMIKRVTILGFTDNRGGKLLNKNISASRAKNVVTALAQQGVDQAILSSEGRGEDSPIADNSTAEGRSANRRVEIHIEFN